MGRKKSLNNEGRFILYKHNGPNGAGEYPVYLRYNIDRKMAIGAVGVWIKETDWDEIAQKVKPTNVQSARYNGILKKKKTEVDGMIIDYQANSNNKRITIDIIRQMVQGTFDPNKREVVDFMQITKEALLYEYKTQKLVYSTYYNACKYMDNFGKFVKIHTEKDELDVADVTEDLVDAYILWRKQDRGNCNETVNKTLTPILKGLSSAISKNLLPPSILFAIKAKYLSAKERLTDEDLEDDAVDYLTLDQLKQVMEIYGTLKFNRTRDFLDMFLFSFHACGLRFSDILTLQWSHINFDTRILRKVMYKGHNKILCFQLTQPALDILERWKGKTGKHVFVFGLLADDFDMKNDMELDLARQNKARAVRTSLTEVGKKMDLPFNLRMHVARHSFAVLALDRLRDVYEVSRLLGHRSLEVTQKVYAKFLPETINKEVESKLTFDLTPITE